MWLGPGLPAAPAPHLPEQHSLLPAPLHPTSSQPSLPPEHPQAPLCESSSHHVLHACAHGCTPGAAQQTLILAERRGGSCSSPAPRAACTLSAGPVHAIGRKTHRWVLCGVLAAALHRGLGAVPRPYCFGAWRLSPAGTGCTGAGVAVTFEAAPLSAVVSYYAPRHRARLKKRPRLGMLGCPLVSGRRDRVQNPCLGARTGSGTVPVALCRDK